MLYDPKWEQKTTPQRKLADIYNAAAALIDERGHSIGKLCNSHGSMCLWGAVSQVVDGDPFKATNETRMMLLPLARLVGGDVAGHAIAWNNKEGRTKEEVVDLLHLAAQAQLST